MNTNLILMIKTTNIRSTFKQTSIISESSAATSSTFILWLGLVYLAANVSELAIDCVLDVPETDHKLNDSSPLLPLLCALQFTSGHYSAEATVLL